MKSNVHRTGRKTETENFVAQGFEPTINTAAAVSICMLVGRSLRSIDERATPKIIRELREGAKSLSDGQISRTESLIIEAMLAALEDTTATGEGEGRNLAIAMLRLTNRIGH